MKYISHRGRIVGPDSQDNTIARITFLAEKKIPIEIDIRAKLGELYLGHDKCQEKITVEWLSSFEPGLLYIHCKDLDSFVHLKRESKLNYFFHTSELVAITSHGNAWYLPGVVPSYHTENCTLILPTTVPPDWKGFICVDYVPLT